MSNIVNAEKWFEYFYSSFDAYGKSISDSIHSTITDCCEIVSQDQNNKNKYWVKKGSLKYEAYAQDDASRYAVGTKVFVLVPQGDYGQKKIIIGAYSDDTERSNIVSDLYTRPIDNQMIMAKEMTFVDKNASVKIIDLFKETPHKNYNSYDADYGILPAGEYTITSLTSNKNLIINHGYEYGSGNYYVLEPNTSKTINISCSGTSMYPGDYLAICIEDYSSNISKTDFSITFSSGVDEISNTSIIIGEETKNYNHTLIQSTNFEKTEYGKYDYVSLEFIAKTKRTEATYNNDNYVFAIQFFDEDININEDAIQEEGLLNAPFQLYSSQIFGNPFALNEAFVNQHLFKLPGELDVSKIKQIAIYISATDKSTITIELTNLKLGFGYDIENTKMTSNSINLISDDTELKYDRNNSGAQEKTIRYELRDLRFNKILNEEMKKYFSTDNTKTCQLGGIQVYWLRYQGAIGYQKDLNSSDIQESGQYWKTMAIYTDLNLNYTFVPDKKWAEERYKVGIKINGKYFESNTLIYLEEQSQKDAIVAEMADDLKFELQKDDGYFYNYGIDNRLVLNYLDTHEVSVDFIDGTEKDTSKDKIIWKIPVDSMVTPTWKYNDEEKRYKYNDSIWKMDDDKIYYVKTVEKTKENSSGDELNKHYMLQYCLNEYFNYAHTENYIQCIIEHTNDKGKVVTHQGKLKLYFGQQNTHGTQWRFNIQADPACPSVTAGPRTPGDDTNYIHSPNVYLYAHLEDERGIAATDAEGILTKVKWEWYQCTSSIWYKYSMTNTDKKLLDTGAVPVYHLGTEKKKEDGTYEDDKVINSLNDSVNGKQVVVRKRRYPFQPSSNNDMVYLSKQLGKEDSIPSISDQIVTAGATDAYAIVQASLEHDGKVLKAYYPIFTGTSGNHWPDKTTSPNRKITGPNRIVYSQEGNVPSFDSEQAFKFYSAAADQPLEEKNVYYCSGDYGTPFENEAEEDRYKMYWLNIFEKIQEEAQKAKKNNTKFPQSNYLLLMVTRNSKQKGAKSSVVETKWIDKNGRLIPISSLPSDANMYNYSVRIRQVNTDTEKITAIADLPPDKLTLTNLFKYTEDLYCYPLLIIKNAYWSNLLNNWNGEMVVDNENNMVMTEFMSAGVKNAQNQFSGILLGSLQKAGALSTKTGIYGLQNGERRFEFNENGEFYVGSGSDNYIKFNENNNKTLDIKGNFHLASESTVGGNKIVTQNDLSEYTTKSDLSEYTTKSDLELTEKEIKASVVSTKGGKTNSFSWSLTSTEFRLNNKNNKPVFIADEDGIKIDGEINATTGKIGGWNIIGNVLYSFPGNGYGSGLMMNTSTESNPAFYAGYDKSKNMACEGGTDSPYPNARPNWADNGIVKAMISQDGRLELGSSENNKPYLRFIPTGSNAGLKIRGHIEATSGTFTGGINVANGTFNVNGSTGVMTCTGASIKGTSILGNGVYVGTNKYSQFSEWKDGRGTYWEGTDENNKIVARINMNASSSPYVSIAATTLNQDLYDEAPSSEIAKILCSGGGNKISMTASEIYLDSKRIRTSSSCEFFTATSGGHISFIDGYGQNAALVLKVGTLTKSDTADKITADTTKGGRLYKNWYASNALVITSDFRKKNTINSISEKYSILFDHLHPTSFKYNDGTSDRLHTGFIAQEVYNALTQAQLNTQEFGGLVILAKDSEEEEWGLRYEEFIALNTWQIQKLKTRVTELEKEIKELKNEINK